MLHTLRKWKMAFYFVIGLLLMCCAFPQNITANTTEVFVQFVPAGLTLENAPSNVDFGNLTVTEGSMVVTEILGKITIREARGVASPWSLSVQATDFREVDGSMTIDLDDNLYMNKPSDLNSSIQLSGDKPILTSATGGYIAKEPFTLLSSAGTDKFASFEFTLGNLSLILPEHLKFINPAKKSRNLPTAYTSTMTWSLNATP